MTGFPVIAQSVDVTAESIPPEIPMIKPLAPDELKYSFSQLTICSATALEFKARKNIRTIQTT